MSSENPVEILLVEDSREDAELVIRALRKNGLVNAIEHLEDGVEALDYLFCRGEYSGRDRDAVPRVVLLDLKLPKVSGIEVLREIRAHEATKSLPVVMLTSSGEDRDLKEAYEIGTNSYVVKPVDFVAFHKVMREIGMYWMAVNQPPPH